MSTQNFNEKLTALLKTNPDFTEKLVTLWQEIAENSFLNWYVNEKIPQEAVDDFIAINEVDKQSTVCSDYWIKTKPMSISSKYGMWILK